MRSPWVLPPHHRAPSPAASSFSCISISFESLAVFLVPTAPRGTSCEQAAGSLASLYLTASSPSPSPDCSYYFATTRDTRELGGQDNHLHTNSQTHAHTHAHTKTHLFLRQRRRLLGVSGSPLHRIISHTHAQGGRSASGKMFPAIQPMVKPRVHPLRSVPQNQPVASSAPVDAEEATLAYTDSEKRLITIK